MFKNPDKVIYALCHNHIYDTQLFHYRNLQNYDPHRIVFKLLASLSLDTLVNDEKVEDVSIDTFRYSILQWLFSLVIRDKKTMDIIRYEDSPSIPWYQYFEEYDDSKCEYIKIELDDNGNPSISFSVQILNENSDLFRQFIITLMADRYKNQIVDNVQLIYIFCSEFCVLLDELYRDGNTFTALVEYFASLRALNKVDKVDK